MSNNWRCVGFLIDACWAGCFACFVLLALLLSSPFHVLFMFFYCVFNAPFIFLSSSFISFSPLSLIMFFSLSFISSSFRLDWVHASNQFQIDFKHPCHFSFYAFQFHLVSKNLQINPDFIYYLFINNSVRLLRGILLPNHKPAQKVRPVICYPMHYFDITFWSELFFIYHPLKIVTFEH